MNSPFKKRRFAAASVSFPASFNRQMNNNCFLLLSLRRCGARAADAQRVFVVSSPGNGSEAPAGKTRCARDLVRVCLCFTERVYVYYRIRNQ